MLQAREPPALPRTGRASRQVWEGKMAQRRGKSERKTEEVEIKVQTNLDEPRGRRRKAEITLSAGWQEPGIEVRLIEHFFAQVYRFSNFGGGMVGKGDSTHHLTEDLGICWGQAFKEALGDKAGIMRTASHIMPMQGTVVTVSVDLSGRPWANLALNMATTPMREMLRHILTDMAIHSAFDLFVKVEYLGDNAIQDEHHAIETVGKALGKVLKEATRIEGTEILSTKGTLE